MRSVEHARIDIFLEELVREAKTPEDLKKLAVQHQLGMREAILLIMRAYDCSLVEAKDIYSWAKFDLSLSDYQEKYILPALEEFAREEQEEQNRGES